MDATRCIRCWQDPLLCFCAEIKPAQSPLRLLILQHPQESRRKKSTARLLALHLTGAVHRVGLSWPSLQSALTQPAHGANWAVLYLGPRKDAFQSSERIRILDRKGVPAIRPKIEGLIVLDGNWKQSKSLWWRNPWLVRLKRVVLNPEFRSEYGSLRRQPRANCLSTIEATGAALSALTGHSECEQSLKDAQRMFLARMASVTPQQIAAESP